MKLSVITINRNNADGLRKTIESVVNQNFTDFEYIVIDGASTDGSVEVIKEYADRITNWVSEPDKGIYNAMNKGILKAKGEYLLFLNSGDWLVDNGIFKVVVSELNKDIVYANLIITTSDSHFIVRYPEKLSFLYFVTGSLAHPASFIKRTLFENSLYNENYKISSDWEFFMLAVCKYNCSYKYLNQEISYFDSSGISSDILSEKMIQDEHKNSLSENFRYFDTAYEEIKTLVEYKKQIDVFKGNRWLKLGYKLGLFKQYPKL